VKALRLRADKPRRALPPVSGPSQATLFRNLLKRGVTVVVVSGIAVAGFSAFTASSTNATGTAFADQGALAISSIPALQVATAPQAPSIDDLAAARDEQLSLNGEQVFDSQANAVADARSSALTGEATTIAKEVERLKNLGKFLWPTAGGVGSPYGMRMHPILHYMRLHDGDDIGGKCGQEIYAAQSGVVVKAEMGYNGGSGNNIRIDHGQINGSNVQTAYLHMTDYVVKVGQRVDKGDLVGHVGSTGLSTACHLHFSAYINGHGTDPMQFIGWNPQANRGGDPYTDAPSSAEG
jgi:murein DD-endopeptidase MepM/ murein hydrolase activator NlpD